MEPQNAMPVGAEPTKSSTGALVGSIIIILILVLGALYFWGGTAEKAGTDGATAASASNEAANIDADFNGVEQVNLDEDLNALNQ